MKQLLIVIVSLAFSFERSICQTKTQYGQPQIGLPSPSATFKEVDHYSKREVSIAQLSGKHVILDFWTTGCSACIEGFPKLDGIRRKYESKLDVFLIGSDHFQRPGTLMAKKVYEKYRERWKLDLPITYDESLFARFNVSAVPYVVWIDDKGVVKALSMSSDLTEENIEAFLGGRTFETTYLPESGSNIVRTQFDYKEPFLINGNGGTDTEFEFRSVLARWKQDTPFFWPPFITSVDTIWGGVRKNRVQINGGGLSNLIMLAYGDTLKSKPPWFLWWDEAKEKLNALTSYERIWRRPILEINDTSAFVPDMKTGRNYYCYSLTVPRRKATAALLQRAMRKDIEVYFPYEISIETRSMPCWLLTASEAGKTKLKTKGEGVKINYSPMGFELANVPFYQVIRLIFASNDSQPPIIDCTGITWHIDMQFEAAMMDFPDVIRNLRKHGLLLERGKKDMQVIVVRDRKVAIN